jgi:hypothetical protein
LGAEFVEKIIRVWGRACLQARWIANGDAAFEERGSATRSRFAKQSDFVNSVGFVLS